MSKAASISGRVLDDAGEPVPALTVWAEAVRKDERSALIDTPSSETDDRGEYRLGALPAGTYILSAAGGSRGERRYVRTYYPGPSEEQAQPIAVRAGEEITAIDLSVRLRRAETQTPRADPGGDGRSTVRGRVLRADHRPLADVRVRLLALDPPRIQEFTSTDTLGRYEFRKLAANRYTVDVSKPGYVSIEYGQTRPFEHGKAIDLRDGQTVGDVDFNVPRTGAIGGRVVDELGEPVAGVSVRVLQARFSAGRQLLLDVPSVQTSWTNDLGRFRVHGLPPGRYVVGTATIGMTTHAPLPGYGASYYPGVTAPGDAQRVTVGLSQEVADTDFAIVPARTARMTGTAVGVDGQPFEGALLLSGSLRANAVVVTPTPVRVRPDGTFEVNDVSPGEYVLQAIRPHTSPTSSAAEFGYRFVTIDGHDVANVALRTSMGSTIKGRVIVDGDAALKPGDMRLTPAPLDFDTSPMVGFGFGARVAPDGTFEMAGLFGPTLIRASMPAGWSLKTIRVDGFDTTDTPIQFGSTDQSLTDVEVVVTRSGAEIAGTVSDDHGKPVGDYTTLVFATDPQRWYRWSRFLAFARPTTSGAFSVPALPPGEYYVAAVDRMEGQEGSGEWQDPELLASLTRRATKVAIGESQRLSVNLKLIVR